MAWMTPFSPFFTVLCIGTGQGRGPFVLFSLLYTVTCLRAGIINRSVLMMQFLTLHVVCFVFWNYVGLVFYAELDWQVSVYVPFAPLLVDLVP